jgi:hypothetical protein
MVLAFIAHLPLPGARAGERCTMTTPIAPPLRDRFGHDAPRGGSSQPPDSLSTLINLAGRQRMLSQRVVLHTVLAAQGDLAALTVAQEALDLFRFSHARLLAAPVLHDALHGERGAHRPASAFMLLAEETLSAIAHTQHGMARMVSSLVARAGPVLGVLNDLTQTCETLSRGELRTQQEQQAALREQMCLLAEALQHASAVGDVAALPALAEQLRQLAGSPAQVP